MVIAVKVPGPVILTEALSPVRVTRGSTPVVFVACWMASLVTDVVIVVVANWSVIRMAFHSAAWETQEPIPVGAVAYLKGPLVSPVVTAVMAPGPVMTMPSQSPVSGTALSTPAVSVVQHHSKNVTVSMTTATAQ